jgi:hypothetical protein
MFLLLYPERLEPEHVFGDVNVGRYQPVGKKPREPGRIGVKLFQACIAQADYLSDKAVEAHIALHELAKFFLPSWVVFLLKAGYCLSHEAFKAGAVMRVESILVKRLGKAVDLALVENTESLQPGFQLIDLIRVGIGLQSGYFSALPKTVSVFFWGGKGLKEFEKLGLLCDRDCPRIAR